MKNYIWQLTIKNILSNKKKYSILLVGVIMACFLLNTIYLITSNMEQKEIQSVKVENGDYHFAYEDSSSKILGQLREDSKIDSDSISWICFEPGVKFAQLDESLKVDLLHCNKAAYENMLSVLELKEGRFPCNDQEVIIEEWAAQYPKVPVNVGDTISTNIKGEERRFRVVGLYQNWSSSQYNENINAYTLCNENEVEKLEDSTTIFNVYFRMKSERELKKALNTYQNTGIGNFITNERLMYLKRVYSPISDSDRLSLYMIIPVLFVMVIMIYNAFNIFILEKRKYYGLLKTLGMNKKKMILLVLCEAFIISLVALPVGILLSILIVKFLIPLLHVNNIVGEQIRIYPRPIMISSLIGMSTIVCSAYLSARCVIKISPIEAIRDQVQKVSTRFKNKGTKHVEYDIANRNVKRDKKRYRVTLCGIVISIVLIVGYLSVMDMIKIYMIKGSNEDITLNAEVFKKDEASEKDFDGVYQELMKVDEILHIYKGFQTVNIVLQNGQNVYIDIYDEARLEQIPFLNYIQEGAVDINELYKGKVLAVQSDSLHPGDVLELDQYGEFQISAVLNKIPFTAMSKYNEQSKRTKNDCSIIMSEETANRVLSQQQIHLFYYDIVRKSDCVLEDYQGKLHAISKANNKIVKLVEQDDTKEMYQENVRQVNLFMYCLLALILSVTLINLFNTIYTNIILQQRELAMLRAIGMKAKSIDRIIYDQTFQFCLKGAIIGTLATVIPIQLYGYYRLHWLIPAPIIICPTLLSIVIGYLITIYPLRKVRRQNIIESIRGNE